MPRMVATSSGPREMTDEEEASLDALSELIDLDLGPIRSRRNGELVASDWTQVNDAPLTVGKVAEWAAHRDELRDYPAQSDRVSTMPAWPTPPE